MFVKLSLTFANFTFAGGKLIWKRYHIIFLLEAIHQDSIEVGLGAGAKVKRFTFLLALPGESSFHTMSYSMCVWK